MAWKVGAIFPLSCCVWGGYQNICNNHICHSFRQLCRRNNSVCDSGATVVVFIYVKERRSGHWIIESMRKKCLSCLPYLDSHRGARISSLSITHETFRPKKIFCQKKESIREKISYFTTTELCWNIPAKSGESTSKCSAAHPKKALLCNISASYSPSLAGMCLLYSLYVCL